MCVCVNNDGYGRLLFKTHSKFISWVFLGLDNFLNYEGFRTPKKQNIGTLHDVSRVRWKNTFKALHPYQFLQ